MSTEAWKTHVFYTTADADKPEQICDRNGEVVLTQCKNCGAAECEIDTPCAEFLQAALDLAATQQ